ncbi:hypothetical protein [Desulfosudis oleivorans]|uniref:Uncharacterized protein n=1 Tax=Desulfosudis oleivorans (strain DSM 6200 / JCM 39069 / Hxd3) TaxID=96561 RepID=A8ZUX7_DESOH|nr:hypothetical protein [Desulfosudis oleivorans]ABW68067.1 hypothetical protein Dole_2263 [Desulfosudis oleivorans Hxd3]
MQPLYETAMELTGKLKAARLQAATLSKNLTETEYRLKVKKAGIERALIKQVKNEKLLGNTLEDRTRIFTLALDADTDYQDLLRRHTDLTMELEQAKIEASFMRDRLTVTLAAMKAGEATE